MIGEILAGILGVVFLAGAFMQYRCTGPLWSLEYIAASDTEKKKMRKASDYYWYATACLLIGLSFILTMIYCLTELKGFLYVVFVLAAFLFLLIIYGIIRAMKKSTERPAETGSRKKQKDNR